MYVVVSVPFSTLTDSAPTPTLPTNNRYASAQPDQAVHYVDVECSAAGNVCEQFGVKGYPTVRMLAKTGDGYSVYDYEGARTHGALAEFGASASTLPESMYAYTGIVPDVAASSEEL